jgi:transcription elongation factor GreB
MNKAFVKEDDSEELLHMPDMPVGVRNYITPAGYRALQRALHDLLRAAEAAGEQERGERPAEIDTRIQYLRTRLESAEVVDASVHAGIDRIYFGATVVYRDGAGDEHTVTIVGLDELDPAQGRISWLSPVAQALLGAQSGDDVDLAWPAGPETLHIQSVHYPAPGAE